MQGKRMRDKTRENKRIKRIGARIDPVLITRERAIYTE